MSLPAWYHSPLMKAARREPVERVPVWLMRQAGRYLPEYRALRRQTGFLDLCKTPDLAAEIMLTTVERLGVDAAILFSDLLLILEPLGLELRYSGGAGPTLGNPIRSAGEVDRLRELESVAELGYVLETVRKTRAGLPERLPLLGFAGAPFTLAAYAIEGGASRDYRATKALMYADAGAWDVLLSRLARAVAPYLQAQIDAGAQAVQLFDTWAGCLGVDDYRRYVLPYTRRVVEALAPGVPVIHFAVGNPALLPLLAEAGGSVIGVDWRIGLDDAWRAVGPLKAIQGNLDPAVLFSSPQEIRRRVRSMFAQTGGRPGYIANLGHGVLPHTPVENVLAMVEAVHAL
ncbi:MAG: uroporphyrinogen decarboxylase [Thermoguttaceae bacterium]|jgi:uroporphyrinogen decarboxylase